MADPETLEALKRAYADTIMNTTKEAAARVMLSEKKALKYQQELMTVRDESLHTLLRLKHIYDSKVKETEMKSSNQQQKVDELEAQLGEAEDIVGELRMELRVLRDELKKHTNGQTHLDSDHEEDSCWKNSDASVSVLPEVSSSHEISGAVGSCIPVEQSGSVLDNEIKIPSLTRINSIKKCSSKDNMDRCHHTLPSILKRRKEVEECTQIILEVDRSTANGDFSSSVQVRDVNDGVCLHEVPSCNSLETLEMSVRDGEDPTVSPNSSQKDFTTPVFSITSLREHESDIKSAIGKPEARMEEKTSCENMEVSASPFCEESPVMAVNKNRCIKYTFQRKRKKEVLSNLEGDTSFEELMSMKQKTEEKDNGYLESLKPSFISESSRDSLCVTQAIVPLLEKKGLQEELVNHSSLLS